MDCFVPLMEKFRKQYGFYPEYPVADAGYGSYNNYLYCREHDMELYMKFPMYEKETKDRKYASEPFRAVSFRTDEAGNLICPNDRKLTFSYRKAVKGNRYGRQEEVYTCEDCSDCPYSSQLRKGDKNRTVRLNQELPQIHKEVLESMNCTHGALLRRNRSIQAEGSFGIMKQDRNYRWTRRRSLDFVRNKLYLVLSCATSTNTVANSKDNRSQRSQRNLLVPGVRGTISIRTKLHSVTSFALSIRT